MTDSMWYEAEQKKVIKNEVTVQVFKQVLASCSANAVWLYSQNISTEFRTELLRCDKIHSLGAERSGIPWPPRTIR